MKFLPKFRDRHQARAAGVRARPSVEGLESRMLLYSASGNAWPAPQLVTISFEPDGTNLSGHASNLQAAFNSKFGSASAWQNIILRAAQSWAQQTNLNFAVAADNGSATGSGSDQQGDPSVGDIRVGGYNFGNTTLAQAFLPPPVNNYSVAGDIQFNTGQTFNSGSQYDLYTVAVHEIGHALGLYHSGIASAEEYSSYNGVKNALTSDDIAGIQSIYGGARKPDAYGSDTSFASAASLNSKISTTTLTALVPNADITTVGSSDYYSFTVPSGTKGTIKFAMQSKGLSQLTPGFTVYNASQAQVASSQGVAYGDRITTTYSGVSAGQTFYIKAFSPASTAFGTGAYALTLNFGTNADPAVTPPSTTLANGSPLSAGGGQAVKVNLETLVNTTTAGVQSNGQYAGNYTAIDANGNYVIAWQSAGQDGSGQGIYAQRFDVNGVKVGTEFRVNTTTAGDQTTPSVAMDASGDFVVVWTSLGQDAPASKGVYGQRYNAQGVAQGGEFRVNTTVAGDQQYPGVAMDKLGNFTVTWTSGGQDGSGLGVYAQRYTSLGLPLGFETLVNTTTAGDQQISRIGMDQLGDSVITWTSGGQDGSGLGVYAQRFDPTGLKVGGEFRVNTTTAGDQSYSSVALDALGDFIIAWQSFGQDGSGWGVYAQEYTRLGATRGLETRVSTTTAGDQAFPVVSSDNGGDVLVAWSSNPTASTSSTAFPVTTTYWNTVGQQYTARGVALGGEFQLNSTTGSDQKYASLTMDNQGHVVVAWSGGNAQDNSGVLAQQMNISFSGDSVDGFYAEGDPADPDQSRPVSVPVKPVSAVRGTPSHVVHAAKFGHRPLSHWARAHHKAASPHPAHPAHRARAAHSRHK